MAKTKEGLTQIGFSEQQADYLLELQSRIGECEAGQHIKNSEVQEKVDRAIGKLDVRAREVEIEVQKKIDAIPRKI